MSSDETPQEPDLVTAWDYVAPAYADYWSPRFAPFVAEALADFAPPPGPLAVPGAGPGDEALLLAERFGDREVWALEPAERMLQLLTARELPKNLYARSATAREVSQHVSGVGGLVSCFVLQLLPDRAGALADWRRASIPGAEARVLFWPRQLDGAWGQLGAAIEAATGEPRPAWETPLAAELGALGWRLERSQDVVHSIEHRDVEEAWRRLVDACSLQTLLRRAGPEALARCEARWKANSGLEVTPTGVVHRPTARLWILRAE
ncbi:MAG: class I SAM-dependent methyltransferase [Planctomycetes bacterium]|nr:class I SAM-dependent methyltransferase [Planctomycetota bacterium]